MEDRAACTEEMKRRLAEQKKRYPLMNEEDVVKFAFQGMLGVGHLIASGEDALSWLKKEMDAAEPNAEEPLAEIISTEWMRINLRAAKAAGISPEALASALCRSAQEKPRFTRRDVYDFCVETDGSGAMRAAAEKILDGTRLPRHSDRYREAYAPAYRVIRREYAGLFPKG